MPNDARVIVREVLPRRMADDIWSSRYDKALPISFSAFELSAVLPAVLYMFRFGQRRGRGEFLKTFAPDGGSARDRRRAVTVERVAEKLTSRSDVDGFDDQVGTAILGDLLLCFGLENSKHDLGRDKQVQRVAPAHYMASWVDLPESVTHLRYVPEMMVAMLANQKGDYVERTAPGDRTWFAVAPAPTEVADSGGADSSSDGATNLLLKAFSQGIRRRAHTADRGPDPFDEEDESVGLDQLLMIRLAQQLGSAPDKPRGKEPAQISNQRPIAERAADHFSEDIRRFVKSYAPVVPRHAFVDLLESCVATGMTTILTSVIEILFAWSENGDIVPKRDQQPAGLFVDCSKGADHRLRGLAEQSMDDLMRRVERLPTVLMMLRLLDYEARYNRALKKENIATRPYATTWLNLLGAILHGRHNEASFIHRTMENYCEKLADALQSRHPDATEVLRDELGEPNPVRRLAMAITPLLGSNARGNTIKMVDSTLHIDRPNGLAQKRKTTRGASEGRRQREVRSLVFAESVLDYLVHLLLLPSGSNPGARRLSLRSFLATIRQRYGFFVDAAPPGMAISNELLHANRAILERRLRDLGLLVGVNDAEAMKRLRPRFMPREVS